MTLQEQIQKMRNPEMFVIEQAKLIATQVAKESVRDEMEKMTAVMEQKLDKVISKELSAVVNKMDDGSIISGLTNRIITEVLKDVKGSAGESGEKGEKGEQGEKGERGEQGIPGISGKDGVDGKDGLNGLDGRDGRDGKDGTTDTPNQVIDKVNYAEKKVQMSAIEKLDDELRIIKQAIRQKGGGGGGGMGNPQHEKFTLTPATTSITTAYSIGASGTAIFTLRYQGQSLHYGEHYTVGSDHRTITLLFTPDSGTFADISYIRG